MDSDESSADEGLGRGVTMPPVILRITPGMIKAIKLPMKSVDRQVTDKCWSGFFIVVFISWIVACVYVVHHEADYSFLTDQRNSVAAKNTSQLHVTGNNIHFANRFASENPSDYKRDDSIILSNNTDPKNISFSITRNVSNETIADGNNTAAELTDTEGLLFTMKLFTCIPLNVDRIIQTRKGGRELVILYPPMFIFFIFITLLGMNREKMLYGQPSVIGATFLFVAIFEHLSTAFYSDSFLLSHEKLAYWMIPEILFLVICFAKMFPAVPFECRILEEVLSFSRYGYTFAVGIPVFAILNFLVVFTIDVLEKLAWNDVLFYAIAGGSCYVGLTIYYFGMMVVSCSIRVTGERIPQLFYVEHLFRALFTVARYHFGSACYHATVIFPRIHATFLMNDSKLKKLSSYSIKNRLLMTHWTVYNLSVTWTSINGTNYSESLRELLRFRSHRLVKEYDDVYSYGRLTAYLLGLLLTTNGFVFTVSFIYGLDDPRLSLAAWLMYLKITFTFYLATSFLKATSDAIDFLQTQKEMRWGLTYGRWEERYREYFAEFQLLDGDADGRYNVI